jgi:hypothetical protein
MRTLLLLLLLAPSVRAGVVKSPTPVLTQTVIPGQPVVTPYGQMTGALYRSQPALPTIKKMWVVIGSAAEYENIVEALAKIQAANPGVEVNVLSIDSVDTADKPALFKRLLEEKIEFVLGTNQDIYEKFRSLRDENLAREIPMGYAGRKYVSVDMPRESLDPAVLSDPKTYPARRYLFLGDNDSDKVSARITAGMEGIRQSLQGVLASEQDSGGHKSEDLKLWARLGTGLIMKLAKQNDDEETARTRKQAHKLAAYIEENKIDVLATDDSETSSVVSLMKKMGYHKSLPVVWASREQPKDTAGLNMAVVPAPWLVDAPHLELSPEANVSASLEAAAKMERLPDNFMDQGGVGVKDFELKVAEAIEQAVPGRAARGSYDVHFMLTNGNGVKTPGDANAFGHFGLAVTDERGKAQVWTVQYNNGGSFTGGLGDLQQLSLAEYLYTLWYLPGAVGQAIPLAETAVAPVFDFILRGIDEAQLEAMRRKAAEINARHLKGKDDYRFLNEDGMTNCISMVTQILRAAGYRLPETGIQDPAGQAINMVAELSRWLLNGRIDPSRFGFVVFDRPSHAGPEHYRIPNTAVASPLFNRQKPWDQMTWYQKLWRILSFPYNLAKAMAVPAKLEAFSAMATHKVTVGPNSRELVIERNESSPILRLRNGAHLITELRGARVWMLEQLKPIEERIISALGYAGWQRNPEQSLKSKAKDLKPEQLQALEADIEAHHRLTVKLQLNTIDELIEQRRMELLVIQLADPLGKRMVKGIKQDYALVLAYRDRVLIQDRVLSEAEMDELDVLNERLEKRLSRARKALLEEVGDSAPQSVKMMLGQVSRETLEELQELGGDAAGKGKNDKK